MNASCSQAREKELIDAINAAQLPHRNLASVPRANCEPARNFVKADRYYIRALIQGGGRVVARAN